MKQQIDIATVIGLKRDVQRELSYVRRQDIKSCLGEWVKK